MPITRSEPLCGAGQATRSRILAAVVAMLLAPLMAPAAHAATTMVANSLTLYRDGTVLDWLAERNIVLHDRFDDGLPLSGPVLADTGLPAQYQLAGVPVPNQAAAATESNGQLRLDPTLASVSANAAGGLGQSLRLQLLTDTQTTGLGLGQANSFAVALEVAASDMPSPGFSFGLRLADGQSNLNDVLDLSVSGTAGGLQLVFRRQDFVAGTVTTLAQESLTVPLGADSLVLGFMHATPSSALVQASWGFIDVNNAFVGGAPVFSAATEIFHGEDHVQLSLRAVQAVPEPASLLLMVGGLLGLSGLFGRSGLGGLWRKPQRWPA